MTGLNQLWRDAARLGCRLTALCLFLLFPPWAQAQLLGHPIIGTPSGAIAGTLDRTNDPDLTRPIPDLEDKLSTTALSRVTRTTDPLLDRVTRLPVPPAPREVQVEDNWRAVDHEWVALLRPNQVPGLRRAGVQILSARTLTTSRLVLVRVLVSDRDNNPAAAQALFQSLGAIAADRNHIYNERFGPNPAPEPNPRKSARSGRNALIGLIDTSLNRKHPALKSARIVERDFVEGSNPRPTKHGTGIASLLVGAEKDHEGLLFGGRLVAASVFYQGESGATGATSASLVAALDWLTTQKVRVINMSLAGPPNEVLHAVVDDLWARGVVIVAAVGNDGPAARPLYPAGYESVIGVTAVDTQKQIYRWANQGPQVKFAAWGVGEAVANGDSGYAQQSGTSFAAPIVAARLARLMARGALAAPAAVQGLIRSAEDLGPPGRDDIFGYGLIEPQ
ncbi:MAG: S8 family serine peptidase [Alphaproteobacteria bacterium]|nr:S8 family serine peptidase [Alphaproteobacteria bacterium]